MYFLQQSIEGRVPEYEAMVNVQTSIPLCRELFRDELRTGLNILDCTGFVSYKDVGKLGPFVFNSLFQVILTDRGSEFSDPDALETGIDNFIRTSIYFCDPMCAWQKPGVEKSHEYRSDPCGRRPNRCGQRHSCRSYESAGRWPSPGFRGSW